MGEKRLIIDQWWGVYLVGPNGGKTRVGMVWPSSRKTFGYAKDGTVLFGEIRCTERQKSIITKYAPPLSLKPRPEADRDG